MFSTDGEEKRGNMIETIRKKISLDRSRSHTPGILPYVLYNSSDIKFVGGGDESGNWGNFPLDFALGKTVTNTGILNLSYTSFYFRGENGEEKKASNETNRLKYTEIMSRYNEMQKMLSESVFTVAVKNREKVVLTSNFGEIDENGRALLEDCGGLEPRCPLRYDYEPLQMDFFEVVKDGVYKPRYDATANIYWFPASTLGLSGSWPMPELQEGKYYILMPDYRRYKEIEDWWEDWWYNNGKNPRDIFPVDGESNEFLFCRMVEKHIIGKVEVPQCIYGIRVPDFVYYCDVEEYKKWFEDNGLTSEQGLSGKTPELLKRFEENGGFEFYNFLKNLSLPWKTEYPKSSGYSITYAVPYVSVPISLEDEHEYGGLYENYLYSYSESADTFYEAYKDYRGYSGITFVSGEAIYAESRLSDVMDEDAVSINGVVGLWDDFQNNGNTSFLKCTFSAGSFGPRYVVSGTNGGYWLCARTTSATAKNLKCADGESNESTKGVAKYRTITIAESINNIVPNPTNGDWYYFLIKNNNGVLENRNGTHSIAYFKIPFQTGKYYHLTETDNDNVYSCDYVVSAKTSGDSYTIKYVIGGLIRSGSTISPIVNTGIEYEETFPYSSGTMKTCIDGKDGVMVYYEKIDTESTKLQVYSEDYMMYRNVNIAKINRMPIAETLNGEKMIDAMLFTRDGSDSLIASTKNEIDAVFDRGNAAAFERHLKLTECNTFEDLLKYGNNFYNL